MIGVSVAEYDEWLKSMATSAITDDNFEPLWDGEDDDEEDEEEPPILD